MSIKHKNLPVAFLFYLLVFCSLAGAQQWELLEQRDNSVLLKYTTSRYLVEKTAISGKIYQSISIPTAAYSSEKGCPEVPRLAQSVIIPNRSAVEFEITDMTFKEMKIENFKPSKGVIYRNQDPTNIAYTFNDEIYSQDQWYPQEAAFLSNPFIFRELRGVTVYIHPVQFNPVKGVVRLIETATIKVRSTGSEGENILSESTNHVSAAFSDLYESHFLNYDRLRYPEIAEGDKMIVITTSDNLNAMTDFINWKNTIGIHTVAYEYPAETGGSGTDKLTDFIKEKYTNDKITYVLLVGDAEDIPSPTASGGLSDQTYARVAGTDKYFDIIVGRFSVNNGTELMTVVNKTQQYEQYPDQNGEWYAKATGIASNEGSPKDWEWMDKFREKLLDYGYTEIDKIYDPSASKSALTEAINEGRGWINYMGHGNKTLWGTTGFSSSDAEKLTNSDRLPVVISVACNNGEFDNGTCFAETWLRQGNVTQGKGAVVFLGSYISQPWVPPQHGQQEMVDLIVQDKYLSIGGIIYNGLNKVLEQGNSAGQYLETADTWINFGDPSLQLFTKKPQELSVQSPEKVHTGKQDVELKFDKSIDGRVCFHSASRGILASKIVSDADNIVVPVEIKDENDITLTVTARNHVPVQKSIPVSPSGIAVNTVFNSELMKIVTAHKQVSLYLPFGSGVAVTITDLQGRKVYSFTTVESQWYAVPTPLSSGVHILTLHTKNGTLSKKFGFIK